MWDRGFGGGGGGGGVKGQFGGGEGRSGRVLLWIWMIPSVSDLSRGPQKFRRHVISLNDQIAFGIAKAFDGSVSKPIQYHAGAKSMDVGFDLW